MDDYFIWCFFCLITSIQCVGHKSSWGLEEDPESWKISMDHVGYFYNIFPPTLIRLFSVFVTNLVFFSSSKLPVQNETSRKCTKLCFHNFIIVS